MESVVKPQIVAGIWIGIYLILFIISIFYARKSGLIKRKILSYFKEHYPEKWKEFNQPFPKGFFNRLRFLYFKYNINLPEIKDMKEKADKLHKRCWILLLIGIVWLFVPPLLGCLLFWILK